MRIPSRLRRFFRPMIQAGPVLEGWHSLPQADAASLTGSRPVLILAPHPDDESLGCGGLIADCRARGQSVHVLVVTDGAGSHRNSRAWPPARLTALRQDETRAAGAALGLDADRIDFIGLPDGHAPLRGRQFTATVAYIADHARNHGIGTICTTWPGDPHRDHQAAWRLGEAAAREIGARLLCYPVWGWVLPPHAWIPPVPRFGARLDITPFVAAKQRAIACHRSQYGGLIDDDPKAFRLSADFLKNFQRPFEVFLEAKIEAGVPVHA